MHRDQLLPQVFSFSNVGPKWTHSWLSYVTDDPTQPNATVSVYLRGAGEEHYPTPDANGVYPAFFRTRAVLVRTATSPIRYERRLRDGSVEVFAQADGSAGVGRRVFLTEVTYDSQLRLVGLTDALGQVTTLQDAHPTDALKVTAVTDPFGRVARFDYDGLGRLQRITDVIGIPSVFTYGLADFVAALTTPYGTTTFRIHIRRQLCRQIRRSIRDQPGSGASLSDATLAKISA